MILPSKVKIGAHTIRVRYVDTMEEFGSADWNTGEILINSNMPQSLQESTLIHEMIHFMNSTLDHELLDSLAEQLYQALKENNLLNENSNARPGDST
jgi:Zn-dependent peptidase ImmA (M78 family)